MVRARQTDEVVPEDYAQRIRRLRVRLGLTLEALASLLGRRAGTVRAWEAGRARPSAVIWERLAAAERTGLAGLTLRSMEDGGAGSPDSVSQPAAAVGGDPTALAAAASESTRIDFIGNPERARLAVEAYWFDYAFQANPAFAIETSLIEPLPHQRMAVYEHMLPQPRLRFLLADDAGAGKTIMTGLYIREMLSRRLIGRVLIVPPAGLVGNWQHELRSLFNLPFRIVLGSEAREGNPFVGPASDLLIVSVDTLAGERLFRRLQEPEVEPYDLVVFDEAHKLSASYDSDGRLRATERYRLAEALAGIPTDDARWSLSWSCHHLLLLTATPHMGKPDPYYCLWRLLEPE